MLKPNLKCLFVLALVVAASGCASSGGPIIEDGRVTNIGQLAARLTFKYNSGFAKVGVAPAQSGLYNDFGGFSLAAFNLRGSIADVADIKTSFKNYCNARGGVLTDGGPVLKKPENFTIACEPKHSSHIRDPAYFIFFVNVLLTPSPVAKGPHKDSTDYSGTFRGDSYQGGNYDNPGVYYHDGGNFGRSDFYEGAGNFARDGHYGRDHDDQVHLKNYHNDRVYVNRDHHDSVHHHHAYRQGTAKLRTKLLRSKDSYKGGGYCINFLASENYTHNTRFSRMPKFKPYREEFEKYLKSTKTHC